MKKVLKRLACFLAAAVVFSCTVVANAESEKIEKIYKAAGEYLSAKADAGLSVGSTGGEWIVIGLARSGVMTDAQKAAYYEVAADYIDENADSNDKLHSRKSTDNSRVILALTAVGRDPRDIGGHNLFAPLSDLDYIAWQGINGPIWALLALDSLNYPTAPSGASREDIINIILKLQNASGGWALSGDSLDPDITGMAIQALAPYYDKNPEVKAAVDEALDALSRSQRDDGHFASTGFFGGGANAESTAQVIVALTALGIDPQEDARFIKNDRSALDALCDFALEGGGFRHDKTVDDINDMATEQSYYALAAYFRFKEGKTRLYDMTDLLTIDTPDTPDTPSDDPADTPADTPAQSEPDKSESAVITPAPEKNNNNSSEPSAENKNLSESGQSPNTDDDLSPFGFIITACASVLALLSARPAKAKRK